MTPEQQLQAVRVFLSAFLPEANSVLEADLALACAEDIHLDLWSTLIDTMQDYGYTWPMPWHTAPEDVAYGLSALWESYGLSPGLLSNLSTDGKTDAEHLVREFSALAKSQQMVLCHLYEDSDYVVLALTQATTIEQAQQAALEAGGQLNAI